MDTRLVRTTGRASAGALSASLADGAGLADAARKAVKVAAFSVTRRGAQPSYPRAGEI
jgi:ribokinase